MSGLRLLVCIDRSRAALRAARLAVDLIAQYGGEIRAVSVLEDTETTRRIDARFVGEQPAAERLEQGLRSMLDRVTSMGTEHGVSIDAAVVPGEPLRAILREARAWDPDFILIGRTSRSGPGSPMIGSLAMHLVEFTEWPVIAVPDTSTTRNDPDDDPDPIL